jgi:hypothetical protein
MFRRCLFLAFVLVPLTMTRAQETKSPAERWPAAKARLWYQQQPWLVGCNYIPSTAINQLEMWQAETFDPKTIDRELGWAQDLGFTSTRVFLHDLPWKQDDNNLCRAFSSGDARSALCVWRSG